MKNQYFGDVNDYRKYGLLRLLAGGGAVRIGVCWMLTPDDGSRDGGPTKQRLAIDAGSLRLAVRSLPVAEPSSR